MARYGNIVQVSENERIGYDFWTEQDPVPLGIYHFKDGEWNTQTINIPKLAWDMLQEQLVFLHNVYAPVVERQTQTP